MNINRLLDKNVLSKINLISQPKYVVGTQWDGSFEHPKLMLKLVDKKIFIILLSIWTYRCLFKGWVEYIYILIWN